jgi:Ca2+-binding EF-hand superfamily protein
MPLSEFSDQKTNRIFRVFDTDGDGVIERSDFDLAAGRAGEAFGLGPDSPAAQALQQANSHLWTVLAAADTDGDGRISLADSKDAATGLQADPAYAAALDALFDALVAIADGDGDGKLTQDEYIRLFAARAGVAEDHAGVAFRRIDTDGDGFVTAEEIKAAIREYHLNDDPESAGAWLLGSDA